MMKKLMLSCIALCACGLCCGAGGTNELEKLARTEDAHVIWHGDDGKAFWNAHAERFIYPPAFGFTNRADAATYRFTVTDDLLVDHCFEAKEATAPLSPVWAEVPSNGFVRVTCRAFAADGRDLGVVGERRFWKAAGFAPGTYPPAKRSYAEAAAKAFENTLSGNVFMRHLAETGKPDRTFYFSCYPSKMHAAEIRAMIRYAKLRPDRRADAMRLARAAADYLVSVMQPADAPLAYFTPTYEKGEKHADAVNSYFGQNMLDYPSCVGSAFVELAAATGERKYLDAAEKIASTYARLQGEDGTWYLKMWEKDGKPVTENRLTPMSVIEFMEGLHNATGKAAYRKIADRAFAFIDRRLLKDWNWEGQFEDVEPSDRYRNLTKHTACSTAIYLLKRYPGDRGRIAQARELLRFAEDQFVMWTRPSRGDGRGWRTQKGPNPHNLQTDYLGWRCLPGVTEQYGWYVPIDASAAKLIRTYLALYAAEKNPLDLAKARTLGDSVTRAQRDDGSIPTHWTEWSMAHGTDWLNCHLAAAQALEMLAEMSSPTTVGPAPAPSPLGVRDAKLVDAEGREVYLNGVSFGNLFVHEPYMWKVSGHSFGNTYSIRRSVGILCGSAWNADFWERFQDTWITEDDVKMAREMGFNAVRLPFLAETLMYAEEPGITWREDGFARLKRIVGWCRDAGLYVVLDMHGAPGGHTGTGIEASYDNSLRLFTDRDYWEKGVALWREIARRYRDEPTIAMYDLLNEPLSAGGGHKGQKEELVPKLAEFYRDCITAIRAEGARQPVSVEGEMWSTSTAIFGTSFDPAMVAHFHRYTFQPDSNSFADWEKVRERLKCPLILGEYGENTYQWDRDTAAFARARGVHLLFWCWKKFAGTNPSPLMVPVPEGWEKVQAYLKGDGPKPTYDEARRIFGQLLVNMQAKNCIRDDRVADAVVRGQLRAGGASVELDPLFTDGMVLQRGERTRVWGKAAPGEKVRVRYGEPSWFFGLGDTTVETTADKDGRWSVQFRSLSACDEGRTLHVIGGGGELCLTNVVVGDVWVCSGQSNMEMPVTGDGPFWRAANHLAEVAAAQDPLLRVFRIPWRLNAINPECRVEGGPWVVAVGRENFLKARISACAYFFGRQLRRDVKVPIGLIQVPWSGSHIQPWISYSGYVNAGLGKEVRDLERRYANAAKVKDEKDWKAKYTYSGTDFETGMANWRKAFFASDPKATAEATNTWWRAELDDSGWEAVRDVQGDMIPSPHPWDNGKLVKGGAFPPGKDGVQWYRQSVSVKAALAGQDAELHLGNVDDEDETWFNGEKVGACVDCMAKRVYRIPARLVRPGNNVIAVRAADLKLYGCFNMPEEQRLVLADGTSYPLAKGWKAKIEFIADTNRIGEYPTRKMGEAYCSTAMFNAMISPIARLAVTGVIWYQGCSNAGQPGYYDLHKALIADWRRAFDLPEMPFLIVQLASYEGHQPANPRKDDFYLSEPCKADYPYALTREIQARVRDDVENVGLAVTMDIGNHSDIHPRNKQDVGRRLALEAERIAYGRNVVSQGPKFAGAEFVGGKAIVSFTHAEGLTTSDGKAPGAFALGGRDGKFAWATARIVGGKVEVSSPEVKDPVAVRYAYVSYRGDCNLVNGAGLPAEPFRFTSVKKLGSE